jgi:hypothetical protein
VVATLNDWQIAALPRFTFLPIPQFKASEGVISFGLVRIRSFHSDSFGFTRVSLNETNETAALGGLGTAGESS